MKNINIFFMTESEFCSLKTHRGWVFGVKLEDGEALVIANTGGIGAGNVYPENPSLHAETFDNGGYFEGALPSVRPMETSVEFVSRQTYIPGWWTGVALPYDGSTIVTSHEFDLVAIAAMAVYHLNANCILVGPSAKARIGLIAKSTGGEAWAKSILGNGDLTDRVFAAQRFILTGTV